MADNESQNPSSDSVQRKLVTRKHRFPVTILREDLNCSHPVVGVVHTPDLDLVRQWTKNLRWATDFEDGKTDWDLIPADSSNVPDSPPRLIA